MEPIEQYFQEEYIIEKNRIKEISDLLRSVIKTFSFCNEHGWPYELDDNNNKVNILPYKDYSDSTGTMLLNVIAKFLGHLDEASPLVPFIKWQIENEFKETLGEEITDEKFYEYIGYLVKDCKNNLETQTIVKSKTFGSNDPFTLSWMSELIVSNNDKFGEIKDFFLQVSLNTLLQAFKYPNKSILNIGSDENKRRASNHIFPLLRCIHLYKTITQNKHSSRLKICFTEFVCYARIETKDVYGKFDFTTDLSFIDNLPVKKGNACLKNINNLIHNELFDNLTNRVNEQISYFNLQNSLFDTAELVLSIEGLVLIDINKIDEKLLTKTFEILQVNQKHNLYWRPLKPFVTSPQGDILLPLSIEIANSLLRICKHLEIKRIYYFHDFFDIFENYSKWLISNVSQCSIGGVLYRGWRSEHVQKQNVIHPWETAQVVTYLMNYKSMIQDHISFKTLKKSGLSCDNKYVKENGSIKVEKWDESWDVNLEFGYLNCYKDIRDKYIIPRLKKTKDNEPYFSMLLYGPPGTGKSSIAEKLAEALNWRLITITPSDFIKHGEADIEGRAKSIFKTLEEQTDCVILFDEIDRLILDRDSNYYLDQSDFYQFMTPSMLVKIKDLRVKEQSIFIIATNYEERIDSAIKRSGRIDEKYLVNTLNKKQRIIQIEKFSKEKIKGDQAKEIASKTALYSYTELKTLVKSACKNDESNDSIRKKLIQKIDNEEPSIKLLTYKRRFQIEKEILKGKIKYKESSIFPYKEFFALVYLKIESKSPLSPLSPQDIEDNKLIYRVYQLAGSNLNKLFDSKSEINKSLNEYCLTLNEDGSIKNPQQ